MVSDEFLDDVNVDTALEDTAEHAFTHPVLKVMALLSIGTDPLAALDGAEELASAVNQLARDERIAKHRIAEILSRPGCDYQRALFYTLAGRGIYDNSAQLNGLVRLLQARRDMWVTLQECGRKAKTLGVAYAVPEGEGPRGTFDPDFSLSAKDRLSIDGWREMEEEDRQRRAASDRDNRRPRPAARR